MQRVDSPDSGDLPILPYPSYIYNIYIYIHTTKWKMSLTGKTLSILYGSFLKTKKTKSRITQQGRDNKE